MSAWQVVTIGTLVAFFMPIIIAFINQEHWSSPVKGVVAFVTCVCAALIVVVYEDPGIDWSDWRNMTMMIFGGTLFFYHQFFKPSDIAPKIERATSVK